MAISFVQQKALGQVTNTTIAVTLDAAPTRGNILIAFTGMANPAATNRFTALPAGWKFPNFPFKNPIKNTVAQYWLSCFYIIVPAGAGSTYSWADSGGTLSDLHVVEYTGVDTDNPLDAADLSNVWSTASTTPSVNGVACNSVNTMIIGSIYTDAASACTAGSSGVTFRAQNTSTSPSSLDTFEKLSDAVSTLTLAHASADYASIGLRLRPSSGPNAPFAAGNFPPHPPFPRS
jgi:hypothetical protein